MKPTRQISRRSFLTRVAGGAIAGGGALIVLGGTASAYQVTDSDQGSTSDPAGRGRGSQGIPRCNDADPTDRPGNGRGNRTTDSDAGPNADPPNCGRRPRR